MPQHGQPYYRQQLARVHDAGFGFHADACAPGILALLKDVDGVVLEVGCGSGLLTRHLLDAGHRVIATDASSAMLEIARQKVPEADIRQLRLPDDPLPEATAVVSVGHVLSYLPDKAALEKALVAIAAALRPGGLLAIDLEDLRYGAARAEAPPYVRVEDDWAIFTQFSLPEPAHFVREITTFVRLSDDSWRRDNEVHHNVLVDTSQVPALLADHSVDAEVRSSFGDETLPEGLVAIVGSKR